MALGEQAGGKGISWGKGGGGGGQGRLPWARVRRSSRRLRKDREATWGFPQRSVSSSTSSSNLIQRAVSRH